MIDHGDNIQIDNPIVEVFGFPFDNLSERAAYYRDNRLCPFHNRYPNCTKDKADNPLGVCSVNHNGSKIITCPSRFREDWLILRYSAEFVWGKTSKWTSLPEIRLLDANGQSAGNLDYVIVKYDDAGNIVDFASIEVQGVYISGNLRNPFQKYMDNPCEDSQWNGRNFPRPDYLSSSRKRLIPQMLYKGGIFKSWNKKQCVAIQKSFFETLPELPRIDKKNADIAWFLYDLVYDADSRQYHLKLMDTVYTEFYAALQKVIYTNPGNISDFVSILQEKLDEKMTNVPETHTISDLI